MWFLSHQELLLPQGQNIPAICCALENYPAKAFLVFIHRWTLNFIQPISAIILFSSAHLLWDFFKFNFASIK